MRNFYLKADLDLLMMIPNLKEPFNDRHYTRNLIVPKSQIEGVAPHFEFRFILSLLDFCKYLTYIWWNFCVKDSFLFPILYFFGIQINYTRKFEIIFTDIKL